MPADFKGSGMLHARPEPVEGRAGSWFDKYILSEALILRQAQDERRVEGLTTSETVSHRLHQSPARVDEARPSITSRISDTRSTNDRSRSMSLGGSVGAGIVISRMIVPGADEKI